MYFTSAPPSCPRSNAPSALFRSSRSSGSVVGSLSSSWIRVSRSPGAASASSASANACIRKSRAALLRVGAVEPIEERRDLEQPRAVLDEVLVDDLGAGRAGMSGSLACSSIRMPSARRTPRASASHGLQDVDALRIITSVRISCTSNGWPMPLSSMIVSRPPRCSWNSASPRSMQPGSSGVSSRSSSAGV